MRDRVKISLQPLGQVLEVERGRALHSLLQEYGVEFPCGGRGDCGGCRVKSIGGEPLSVSEEDGWALDEEELAEGWRLACKCRVDRDVTLEIGQWETFVLADQSRFEFVPRAGWGIAVDLGTTTVVAQLLELQTGRVLGVRSMLNPQTVFGSDVMHRIHAAVYEGRRVELVGKIRAGIGGLAESLAGLLPRDATRINRIAIVGNTVMHHLFCDIDVAPLATAPFEAQEGGTRQFAAEDLGWSLPGDPEVVFLPCLGGFVGSDVLCGIVATGMDRSHVPFVLVDLGTNGEIVIGDSRRMLCASTAAGPAFEGGRISMGMRATTGAVSGVIIDEGRFRCEVIGDAAPRGVCGSGLVDAVAAGLELGLIEAGGRLRSSGGGLEIAPGVRISQADIRELQLAKAAIAAGIHVLRDRLGLGPSESPRVVLAGAFGNYVRHTSAQRIGLAPGSVGEMEAGGNTALLGAKMALFEEEIEAPNVQAVRERVEHIALASDALFNELFVGETVFPG